MVQKGIVVQMLMPKTVEQRVAIGVQMLLNERMRGIFDEDKGRSSSDRNIIVLLGYDGFFTLTYVVTK